MDVLLVDRASIQPDERHSCRNDAAETPRGLSRRGRGLVCAGWWSANVPFRGGGLVIPVGPRMGSECRGASSV